MARDPMFDKLPKTPKLKLDPEIEREINTLPKKPKKPAPEPDLPFKPDGPKLKIDKNLR